ncbi:MAG: hypothetical protein K9I82_08440 [Chitinophagaceae bacterium]|nr:hypothetical protein [Chitinophagaceae bacterium]
MTKFLGKAALFIILVSSCVSCAAKYGCPSDGRNIGAERILSGEKIQKSPKFKVKQ